MFEKNKITTSKLAKPNAQEMIVKIEDRLHVKIPDGRPSEQPFNISY